MTGVLLKQVCVRLVTYDVAMWIKPYFGTTLATVLWDGMTCHSIMKGAELRAIGVTTTVEVFNEIIDTFFPGYVAAPCALCLSVSLSLCLSVSLSLSISLTHSLSLSVSRQLCSLRRHGCSCCAQSPSRLSRRGQCFRPWSCCCATPVSDGCNRPMSTAPACTCSLQHLERSNITLHPN